MSMWISPSTIIKKLMSETGIDFSKACKNIHERTSFIDKILYEGKVPTAYDMKRIIIYGFNVQEKDDRVKLLLWGFKLWVIEKKISELKKKRLIILEKVFPPKVDVKQTIDEITI